MNTSPFRAPPINAFSSATVPGQCGFQSGQSQPGQIAVSSGLGAARIPLPRWKRAIDLIACIFALPFLGVCTVVMTILTKCVSPGPVFFRQERIGYMGRRFKIYKFRTMKCGADSSVHRNYTATLIRTNAPMVKLDARGDARLIPFGWLLRASGLDELPQFFNVLRGEMSLVGPRPCIPAEFEQYVSWQRQRCDALPGLTGLWQVSGKNRTTFDQMIRLDIQYSRKYSVWLDLKIILLTAPCLLAQLRDTREARKSQAESTRKLELEQSVSNQFNGARKADGTEVKNCEFPSNGASSPAVPDQSSNESLLEWLNELSRRSSRPASAPPIAESSTP